MSSRISTGMMFNQSVTLMLAKQAKLNHLEQQIATGSKIVSAKDDRRLRIEVGYGLAGVVPDILCIAKGLGTEKDMPVPPIDPNAWNTLKLTKKRVVGIMSEIDAQIAKAIELFETMR